MRQTQPCSRLLTSIFRPAKSHSCRSRNFLQPVTPGPAQLTNAVPWQRNPQLLALAPEHAPRVSIELDRGAAQWKVNRDFPASRKQASCIVERRCAATDQFDEACRSGSRLNNATDGRRFIDMRWYDRDR